VSTPHGSGRRQRRVALLLFGLAAASCAVVAATATGAASQRVTLTVERFFEPACTPLPGQASSYRGGCHKLRFSGTIPSGQANEYVSVLHQKCGVSGLGTSLVGAQTQGGGSWEAQWLPASGTFRARWGASVSEAVRFRDSVRLQLTMLSPSRQHMTVTGDQDMKGRLVELQRLTAGQWRTLRRARFVADRSSYGVKGAVTFTVRQPGLVLRAFVPERSARPCYTATASETWTSGVRRGSPGTRVIDRALLCSTGMRGGIRMVKVHASPVTRRGPTQNEASFSVWSGDAGSLVGASTGSLTINPEQCEETGARVPPQAGKLLRRPLGPDGRTFMCEVPLRVLVRVRAVFREATSLERNPPPAPGYDPWLAARGEVSLASLIVRTLGGRPLAFATVSASGRPQLHVARTCMEDT
jgi:hypothetical protein